ncbi:MAG TPA: response regulator transcription factor [Terriglobales bacterium]|nr:response regulator transcription factor [Terriglobales bacterium]
MQKLRVVLADDHPEMIARIIRILDDEFEIIDVVENGDNAVGAVLALDPDIFLTDISMPRRNGFQAARIIQEAKCRAKIIFLTIHEDRDLIAAAFSAGAAGYVVKRCMSTDLVSAIHMALKGRVFVSDFAR